MIILQSKSISEFRVTLTHIGNFYTILLKIDFINYNLINGVIVIKKNACDKPNFVKQLAYIENERQIKIFAFASCYSSWSSLIPNISYFYFIINIYLKTNQNLSPTNRCEFFNSVVKATQRLAHLYLVEFSNKEKFRFFLFGF